MATRARTGACTGRSTARNKNCKERNGSNLPALAVLLGKESNGIKSFDWVALRSKGEIQGCLSGP